MLATEKILHHVFKLSTFRKGQLEIIDSVLAQKDTLAVMPTGGGKSLCYQLPALLNQGTVIVVSPLISLMEDQVRKLRGMGIPAGFVCSGQTKSEKLAVFAELKRSENFILYLSPERIQKEGFAEWVVKQPISLFAIDEAHCVSQWGPDFREDYYKLHRLRKLRPEVPILALTASATPEVLRDIAKQLELRTPDRHIHGFYRPNLFYQVHLCQNDSEKVGYIRQALRQTPKGRILIYCGTRKYSEELASTLANEFPDIGAYHAGMPTEDRTAIQRRYEKSEIRILAATNAFGMGIDHPDVRLVVHYQMPANVEHYYQEIGRAGRDGEHSTCLLLYSKKDKGLHSYFIQKSGADSFVTQRRWNALNTLVQFAEGGECRHSGILTYFKDSFRLKKCGHCDICAAKDPRKIALTYDEDEPVAKKKKTKRATTKKEKDLEDESLTPTEELRYEVLREWRKNYADEKDVPPFLIFSNKTLRDLCRKNPRTLRDLEKVYGFGSVKVESLGDLILSQLRDC